MFIHMFRIANGWICPRCDRLNTTRAKQCICGYKK